MKALGDVERLANALATTALAGAVLAVAFALVVSFVALVVTPL